MPVDYSKWDALELSDDSDIEVHPNVDKRSFIRAKQSQIHQERYQRKHQIEVLKYEKLINAGFMRRLQSLLVALNAHHEEADKRNPDELVFMAIMESAGDPEDDLPPPRPEGIHTNETEMATYSKMMVTLVDQVKADVDAKNAKEDSERSSRFDAYVAGINSHHDRVVALQKELLDKLAELEKEESRKITSESIHTGFDSSHIAKADPKPEAESSSKATSKGTSTSKVQAVELLNPHVVKDDSHNKDKDQSSGADADIDEPPTAADSDDEADIQPTALGRQFAALPTGDYRAYMQFISQHPLVISEHETDGLLVLAFNSQLAGESVFARQCVHQALLLQYCRSLGRDGVGLFFKRITTRGHQAQKVFSDDVRDTYERIRARVKEIKDREGEDQGEGGAEQIQLHAVEPGTAINITIPDEGSSDEEMRRARTIFEGFSPGLRRALESGKLEEVNRVLGKMSVDEAEEVVGLLGEGGMLSLEEKIIDATTEEGQAALKQFEEEERARLAAAGEADGVQEVEHKPDAPPIKTDAKKDKEPTSDPE